MDTTLILRDLPLYIWSNCTIPLLLTFVTGLNNEDWATLKNNLDPNHSNV